jgi:hypothetical protein
MNNLAKLPKKEKSVKLKKNSLQETSKVKIFTKIKNNLKIL